MTLLDLEYDTSRPLVEEIQRKKGWIPLFHGDGRVMVFVRIPAGDATHPKVLAREVDRAERRFGVEIRVNGRYRS